MATLPGAWHYRASTGTGRPGVSILWLGEVESLICNFYLGVAARNIVWADPFLRYTSLLLGCYTTNQQTSKQLNFRATFAFLQDRITCGRDSSSSSKMGLMTPSGLPWLSSSSSSPKVGKIGSVELVSDLPSSGSLYKSLVVLSRCSSRFWRFWL